MLLRALCFSGLAAIFLASPIHAQQLSQTDSSSQAASLLRKSLAAQTGGNAVTDVTLAATIRYPRGSKSANAGSAVFTALADGTSRAVLNLPSGTATEVWSLSNGTATISSSGPKGNITQPAGGDLSMPGPAWFSPALLTALVSGSAYAKTYVGSETRNGTQVDHIEVWQVPSDTSQMLAFAVRQQTQADIYLDPKTFLPVATVFRVRPQQPPGKRLSIRAPLVPEEVRYSNYVSVGGRMAPARIQVYLGRNEAIDITISSVAFNTGATITAPN